MNAVIFAGPSLPPNLRPPDPALIWRPPVRQGELYRAALTRPAIIGVVDGYFEVTPTVWHKEILWAMAQGIHVYGSASIGALRAAELAPFGMKGVGQIYEAFRDGILEDDDEVAVLHCPEELGYPPVTDAMVNIRATLAQAARFGIVEPYMAGQLIDIAKALFYQARTYAAVFHAAGEKGLPSAPLAEFEKWLPKGRVDQKSCDALEMMNAVHEQLTTSILPLRVAYKYANTIAWEMQGRAPHGRQERSAH
jgi:hypothetical protein